MGPAGIGATDRLKAKTDMGSEVEVGVLIYPDVQIAAVHGLTDLFAVANRVAGEMGNIQLSRIRVTHWQLDGFGRLAPVYDSHPGAVHALNVLVIPPSLGGAPPSELLERHCPHLCDWHGRGAVLASVCIGVFFLAASGVLDRRPASTHQNYVHALLERYPEVRADANVPLLDDGDVVTSAGLMAWTGLGLRLLERFLGATLAFETARYLSLEPLPSAVAGALFVPRLDHGDEAVLKVQHWLQGGGVQHASVSSMAACAGLEERTFLRRFRAATGLRPTHYCQQIRVGRACRLLEFTRRNVDHIAWEVGYQDPGAFRKVFQAATGFTPSDYRRRFAPTV